MNNLTIIIPVFNIDNKEKEDLLRQAVKSCEGQTNIIAVGDKKSLKLLSEEKNIKCLENTSRDLSYAAQVDFAVSKVETEYFSVLEYDDAFTPIWFKEVEHYIKSTDEDLFGILPLTMLVDVKGEGFGFANEAYWATSFSEEIGYLDLNSMLDYFNFNASGGIFKTAEFKALGMLKPSMKLVFWFEFLLRALYKGKKIYVIPKIGYRHMVGRKDSLSEHYEKEMTDKEGDWWIDLAKKEYYFPNDRNKKYEE